ncbi:uncharacterized protein RCC_09200 [Ramularia collo-cygni]|uniref:Uncharacterized protein n=1 Tax=Ramularia collo-cygni TaxID=112498 RepID=A0A2D3V279_9PEZI|nr:uncharacterized protein RCC_09200 [Ramularia collo-cygni]CZT23486.1 uncharacterized protein RCC_09200 [Ramularia collo-cygni]
MDVPPDSHIPLISGPDDRREDYDNHESALHQGQFPDDPIVQEWLENMDVPPYVRIPLTSEPVNQGEDHDGHESALHQAQSADDPIYAQSAVEAISQDRREGQFLRYALLLSTTDVPN